MEPEPLSKRSAPTVTLNPHPPKMFPEKFIGFVEVEVEQRWYFFLSQTSVTSTPPAPRLSSSSTGTHRTSQPFSTCKYSNI